MKKESKKFRCKQDWSATDELLREIRQHLKKDEMGKLLRAL